MTDESLTAFVTGASKGIGRTVALGLAAKGYRVAVAARSFDKLESLSEEILSLGSERPLVFPIDVADELAVEEMAAAVVEEWGKIDVVFNNAGINRRGTTDISYKDFDDQIAVNLRGAFNVLKAVVPYLKGQGFGHIINVSSIAGTIGFAGVGAYASTKFAVRGLGDALFRELVPLGIKVTTLCPSWVDTDMAAHGPLKPEQMIDKEDFLRTIDYLLSLSPAACIKELVIECRHNLS